MLSSTVLSGAWTFDSRCIVNTYWEDTARQHRPYCRALTFVLHAHRRPGYRAAPAAAGARGAVQQARRAARAPAHGQALAPRRGALRAPVRARAPSEGD